MILVIVSDAANKSLIYHYQSSSMRKHHGDLCRIYRFLFVTLSLCKDSSWLRMRYDVQGARPALRALSACLDFSSEATLLVVMKWLLSA
jgi:hypothetical protein